MRTLTRPTAGLDLTPRQRANTPLSAWRTDTKKVKEFAVWALANQADQCAFCGFDVGDVDHRRSWELDHFAPQGDTLFPQWRFEPLNIIVTCRVCNGKFKLGYNSVTKIAVNYEECEFSLVHPYMDSVDDHLKGTYKGGSQRVGAPSACSSEGIKTIEIFRLDDPNYLSAINGQALRISIDDWKAGVPGAYRSLLRNALAELSGRKRYSRAGVKSAR